MVKQIIKQCSEHKSPELAGRLPSGTTLLFYNFHKHLSILTLYLVAVAVAPLPVNAVLTQAPLLLLAGPSAKLTQASTAPPSTTVAVFVFIFIHFLSFTFHVYLYIY